jgi:spore germination protein KC
VKESVKYICISMIAIFTCVLLSGCYDRREVDDLTYVIAIGFDKGKTNALRMTLQYVIPTALGGEKGGSGGGGAGGGGSQALEELTVETPTIFAGLNMANNFIGKQINLSHAKIAVFSQELAKSGRMHEYIHAMERGREFRPNLYIAVSRCSPEDYLKSVRPKQEADPARYYEKKFLTYLFTGFSAHTILSKFYFQQESLSQKPVAALVGLGTYKSTNDFDPSRTTAALKDRNVPLEGDYLAGDIPKTGDLQAEVMGLAVFDGKRMVGELDGQESIYYLMVTNEYNYSFMSFNDPNAPNEYVVLSVKKARNTACNVEINNDRPKVNLKVKLEADILSIQSGINYEQDGQRKTLEKSIELFLKNEITRFLEKTSGKFQSDICGIGKNVKGRFLTWSEWEKFKWLEKYKNAYFNVNVELKIRRPGLMIRSVPAVSSKEGE